MYWGEIKQMDSKCKMPRLQYIPSVERQMTNVDRHNLVGLFALFFKTNLWTFNCIYFYTLLNLMFSGLEIVFS